MIFTLGLAAATASGLTIILRDAILYAASVRSQGGRSATTSRRCRPALNATTRAHARLGKFQFDALCRFTITSKIGSDRPDLFVSGDHQKSRCAAIRLHASEVKSWFILRKFTRAMGTDRPAAMFIGIDQWCKRDRRFDRRIKPET